MKRFWLVLLSLGLVMAFSASAFAVDVKFSGEFYAAGEYLDKINVRDDGTKSVSTAFMFQRLRLQTEFIAAPGLSLITRANIMDRAWGADRSAAGVMANPWSGFPGGQDSAGTAFENQNIAFDWAYIHYISPIGIWDVGYMKDGPWGTKFGDSEYANPRIVWILPAGNFMFLAAAVKLQDHSYISYSGNTNAGTYTDSDSDKYAAAFLYQWKGGQAGLLLGYWRYAFARPTALNSTAYLYGALPYLSAQFGPVKVEAELWYVVGDLYKTDSGVGNVKVDNNILAYVDATVDLGMVYFGGMFVYASGNDPSSTDKVEGGVFGTGENLRPTLLLFNDTRYRETGSLAGYNATSTSYQMVNGFLFQGRVGVRPMDKLDIMASLTYAIVDKKGGAYGQAAGTWVGDTYGTEIDVTATYKISNNLSYMLGGAYLFTGSYFKGTNDNNAIFNDYLIINKLTLTF